MSTSKRMRRRRRLAGMSWKEIVEQKKKIGAKPKRRSGLR